MAGNVYTFNCYNEPVNALNVNGSPFGTANPAIGPWATTGGTIYTPVAVPVPIAKHGDDGAAAFSWDMDTPVRINWDSYTVNTSVPAIQSLPNTSLDDPLILYLAINQLTLMNARGFVLKSIPCQPAGQTREAMAEVESFVSVGSESV